MTVRPLRVIYSGLLVRCIDSCGGAFPRVLTKMIGTPIVAICPRSRIDVSRDAHHLQIQSSEGHRHEVPQSIGW